MKGSLDHLDKNWLFFFFGGDHQAISIELYLFFVLEKVVFLPGYPIRKVEVLDSSCISSTTLEERGKWAGIFCGLRTLERKDLPPLGANHCLTSKFCVGKK